MARRHSEMCLVCLKTKGTFQKGTRQMLLGLSEGRERQNEEAVLCDDILMNHNDFTQIPQAGGLEPLDKDVSVPENRESRFLYLMTS